MQLVAPQIQSLHVKFQRASAQLSEKEEASSALSATRSLASLGPKCCGRFKANDRTGASVIKAHGEVADPEYNILSAPGKVLNEKLCTGHSHCPVHGPNNGIQSFDPETSDDCP